MDNLAEKVDELSAKSGSLSITCIQLGPLMWVGDKMLSSNGVRYRGVPL